MPTPWNHNIHYHGIVLQAAVATLHHLPLRPALERFRALLKPGGALVIVGLYRLDTFTD